MNAQGYIFFVYDSVKVFQHGLIVRVAIHNQP